MWQIYVLIAAVFKAGYDINLKGVLKEEHTSETLLSILLMNLLLVSLLAFRVDFALTSLEYLILFSRAILIVVADLLFFKAVRHSDLSLVVPFYNLSPVFLIGLSYMILGERLTFIELGGIGLLILGSFFLRHERSTNEHTELFKSKYIVYIFIALFLWSLSATLGKYVASSVGTLEMLYFTVLFATLVMLFYHSLQFDGVFGVYHSMRKHGRKILQSSVFNLLFLAFYFYSITLPETKISLVVPLLRFSVFLDIIIGGTLFHEQNIMKKLSASAVMLVGMIIIIF